MLTNHRLYGLGILANDGRIKKISGFSSFKNRNHFGVFTNRGKMGIEETVAEKVGSKSIHCISTYLKGVTCDIVGSSRFHFLGLANKSHSM